MRGLTHDRTRAGLTTLLLGILSGSTCLSGTIPAIAALAPLQLTLAVDDDDDDGDGVRDCNQLVVKVPVDASKNLARARFGSSTRISAPAGPLRWLVDGRSVTGSATASGSAKLRLQACKPGVSTAHLGATTFTVHAVRVMAVDATGHKIDLTQSHASFQRTPPQKLRTATEPTSDPDALRYVFIAARKDLPTWATITSVDPKGKRVDKLTHMPLVDVRCPALVQPNLSCRSTWPIRVALNEQDANHPASRDRSIIGSLGGALILTGSNGVRQQIRVGGPRLPGMAPRYRAHLHVSAVRYATGDTTAYGATVSRVRTNIAPAVRDANQVWAQCGVSFGAVQQMAISLVTPNRTGEVTVGCVMGLPASGGVVRARVGRKIIRINTSPGQTPVQVSRQIEIELKKAGYKVHRAIIPRAQPSAFPVVDLTIRDRAGKLVPWRRIDDATQQSDPTLQVCKRQAWPSFSLRHFTGPTARTGRLEERALLDVASDGNPSTIDVVWIPSFAGQGRIGESLVGRDPTWTINALLLDAAGLTTIDRSHVLAHEVGHVLTKEAGHTDDYGVDTPTLLMDSDEVSSSAFGPERLPLKTCEKILARSGPGAHPAILESWPLGALPKPEK